MEKEESWGGGSVYLYSSICLLEILAEMLRS